MRFEAAAGPGLDWTGAALVTNGGAAPGRIRAEALDFALDEDGQPVFGDLESERRWSCRDWLVMNPWEAGLAAGASALARLTVRVPDRTPEGGYHCAAAYRLEPPAPSPAPVAAHWPPVRDYLVRLRGLDPALLDHCLHAATLYADRRRNAVFTCRDRSGNPTGAELVGTRPLPGSAVFKGLAPGSRRDRVAFG